MRCKNLNEHNNVALERRAAYMKLRKRKTTEEQVISSGPGSSIKEAIKVRSVREEINYVNLQRCPICYGKYRIKSNAVTADEEIGDENLVAKFMSGERPKIFDIVGVVCPNEHKNTFYFDINDILYVRDVSHSPFELLLHHVSEFAKEMK